VNTENLRTDEVAAYSEYTVSQNDSALACYNFDMHQPILIIFGKNVAKKVSSQIYFIFPPHITIASALPGEKKAGN